MVETETTTIGGQSFRSRSSRKGVNVATFDNPADAEELRDILQNDGIAAWVQDERRLQRFWFFTSTQAGLHVRVMESAFDVARRRLAHPDVSDVLSKAVHCPSCRSCRVEYPAMTRKNVLPTLVAQIAVAMRLTQHRCYCEDCHYTWVRRAPGQGVEQVNTALR